MKLLGDGVMFHFPDPAQGVLCGLALVEGVPQLGLPRARMGMDSGPVVFQNGDYFGRTVNIAARICDYARPGEVLVSDEVAAAAHNPQAIRYEPVGPVSLKGLDRPHHPLHRRPRRLTLQRRTAKLDVRTGQLQPLLGQLRQLAERPLPSA